jgi:hypothetical protein
MRLWDLAGQPDYRLIHALFLIDELVRRSPERAYDIDFFEQFAREVACLPDIALHNALPHRRRGSDVACRVEAPRTQHAIFGFADYDRAS